MGKNGGGKGLGELAPMWITALAALIGALALFKPNESTGPSTGIEIDIDITIEWPRYHSYEPFA